MKHIIRTTIIIVSIAIFFNLISCNLSKVKDKKLSKEEVTNAPCMIIDRTNYITIDTNKAKTDSVETIQTFFDSIRYVQLETKDTIRNIENLKIIRDKIYIFDDILKKLFIFNMEGKMSKSIPLEKLGEDFDSEKLAINYTNDKKINILNTSVNKNIYPNQKNVHDYFIAITKRKIGSIYRKALKVQALQKKYKNAPQPQVNSQGKYLFTPTLSDTVYEIENDSTLKIKYVIKHEETLWAHEKEALNYDIIEDKMLTYTESAYCGTMFENKENAIFKLEKGVNEYLTYPPYIYNKKTKQTYHLNSGIQKLSQIYLSIFPMAIYKDQFVSVIKDPYNYKKYFNNKNNISRNDDNKLYRLINKSNRNPILVFFK